jgi:GTPase SAR1 family protein
MRDYATELMTIARNVCESARGQVEPSILEKMLKEVCAKCHDLKPGIMIYGVYNSGKSTLLNALLGEDATKTSDVPETQIVSEYAYRNYRIYDTPGIDAPLEHEKISRAHLARVEVVIFVVSAGGLTEEAYVYREIAEIAASKPMIIVMNDKQGLSPEDTVKCINQLHQHLLKAVPGDTKRIPVIRINAASALRAKLENKTALLNQSNILQLENEIARIMSETSVMNSARTAATMIEPVIQSSLAKFEQDLRNDDGRRKLFMTESRIRQLCRELFNQGTLDIGIHCDQAVSEIRNLMASGIDNEKISDVIDACDTRISSALNKLLDKFIVECETELQCGLECDRTTLKRKTKQRVGETNSASCPSVDRIVDGIGPALKSVSADAIRTAGLGAAKTLGQTASGQTGTVANTLICCGKTAKWIGKNAGKCMFVLQALTSALDIWMGHREDQAKFEAERNRVMTVNQAVEDLRHEMRTGYETLLEQWITGIQTKLNEILSGTKQKIGDEHRARQDAYDSLLTEKANLESLTGAKVASC